MKMGVILFSLTAGLMTALTGCSERSGSAPQSGGDGGAINLIPGPGFEGFIHFLQEASPAQNRDEAWTVEDGILHITGKGWGYLRTEEEYGNFHLTIEYKWGPFTAAVRENRARDSGVFVHASANDGEFRDAWVSSFEAQMIEGRAGDIIVLAALDKSTGKKAPYLLTSQARKVEIPGKPPDFAFAPGSEPRKLPAPRLERARIFRDPHDYDWKDEKGYRTPNEIEKPAGEWNTLEVIATGDTLEIFVNGLSVNKATDVTPSKGHICLQSEMGECWVRKWELRPLN